MITFSLVQEGVIVKRGIFTKIFFLLPDGFMSGNRKGKSSPLNGYPVPFRRQSPFDHIKVWAFIKSDLNPGNTRRMHTGTGIVVPMISSFLEMGSIIHCKMERLQTQLRQ